MSSVQNKTMRVSELPAPAGEAPAEVGLKGYPFEAMHLKIGDRLQVQPPASLKAERCNVHLIGCVPHASVLMTAPQAPNGVRLELIEGDSLVVRVFSSQNAYAFGCDVLRVNKLPYPYVHTSYPESVQGTVIRKAPRVQTKIAVEVRAQGLDQAPVPMVMTNLSADGAQLHGRLRGIGFGDQLHLTFSVQLHQVDFPLAVQARIRTVATGAVTSKTASPKARVGLEFVDLLPSDRVVLQSLVYQNMIEQPQSMV